MRKSRRLIISMMISIFISSTVIFLCESRSCENIRYLIKQYVVFFDGKKSMIENIFIGIFGSSVISLIGYIFEYNVEKRQMHLKIIYLFRIIYLRYYKSIGTENIESIREKFLQDEVFNEISCCCMEYKRFFSRRDNIYMTAIGIMKWTELYYTNIFCIYSALKEIEDNIKQLYTNIEEMELWKEKDLADKDIADKGIDSSKKTLLVLEECHKDILNEYNNTINSALETKKEIDNKKINKIKQEFGILDDVMAAFYGSAGYINRVWKGVEK